MKALFVLLAFFAPSLAFAQLSYRGEVEVATDSSFSAAFPAQLGWTLAGHLEAGYDLDFAKIPTALTAVLDPSVRVSQSATTEPGVTELYALTTQGDLDLSAGIERLPLEAARLSVPYSVETVGKRGVRRGVPGARATLYRGPWRLRGTAFYQDTSESVTPLVSVKRSFGSFELEAHALYPRAFVTGLSGSGLVGNLVVYGEAWLLTDPFEGRGTVGLNGNLTRGTWTLEAAYLAPGEGSLKDTDELSTAQLRPAADPRPAVLGQLALPLGDEGDMNLTLNGNVFFDPNAVRPNVSAGYTLLAADAELTLDAGARFGPEPAVVSLSLGIRQFF